MDIYSAQSQLKKIRRYADELAQSNHTLYGKSKTKIRLLIEECETISTILSNMLDDPYSDDPVNEFAATTTSITTSQRKEIFANYKYTLKHVSEIRTFETVKECADLVWTWFSNRFIYSVDSCPNFHYSLYKLPIWISAIVIKFGYEFSYGDITAFIIEMKDWCNNISVDSHIGRYPLPYSVYRILSDPQPGDANLVSVIIWDVLQDMGYSKLIDDKLPELSLAEDAIYQFCARYRPSSLDNYTRYTFDESILAKVGIQ